MNKTLESPEVIQDDQVKDSVSSALEKCWNVIVWDDPVNLMTYVTLVFMKVLGMNKDAATKHMLEVHKKGKSIVTTTTKERAELIQQRLQSYSLTTSIEKLS